MCKSSGLQTVQTDDKLESLKIFLRLKVAYYRVVTVQLHRKLSNSFASVHTSSSEKNTEAKTCATPPNVLRTQIEVEHRPILSNYHICVLLCTC